MSKDSQPAWRRYLSFWGANPRADVDAELRFHFEMRVREYVARGMSRAEAERAALARLGNVRQAAEEVVTIDQQQARTQDRLAILGAVRQDLAFAARMLRREWMPTLLAVLCLALGIGATTAMLSVVRSVLIEPLPYRDADQLVVALHNGHNPVGAPNFLDWRADTRSFTDMAAAELWSPSLTGTDDPEELTGLRITPAMLPMLGVAPLLGRVFSTAEGQAGAEHEVLLSYALWQREFAGDRSIVGKSVMLDGHQYTIIGVMPATFQFAPFWATHSQLWAPLVLPANAQRSSGGSLRVFARLKPGVSFDQARADLGAVTSRLEREYPGTNQDIQLLPLKEKAVGDVRTPLLVLLVAVGLVLLIACANVAHMLLARGAARHRELAVRTALGATRRRIVGQLLAESGLLAAIGGAGGLLIALVSVRTLVAASPAMIPRVATVRVDGAVLALAIAITALTAIAFGLVPALRAARVDLVETFRDGDRGSSEGRGRGRLRSALVASEFALALVLLAGAGLMMRSFVALQHVDPGFDPSNVVSMIVSTVGTPAADSTRHAAFYVDALARIKAIPGVVDASYINHRPLDGDMWGFGFRIEGRPVPKPGTEPTATYRVVFPGYFATMRIPIIRGRDVAETDRANAPPVAVISDYTAREHWPGEDPIGKRITLDGTTWVTIVGVVKNVVSADLAEPPSDELYLPFAQEHGYVNGIGARRSMTLVARVRCDHDECDTGALSGQIRSAIRGLERGAPISAVTTMSALMREATAEPRFYLALLVAFATIAIALAAVGIYAVMSYAVSRRSHEIGIRMALGAEPSVVLRSIIRQAVFVAGVGACAGMIVALAVTRLMRGLLFGVSPTDGYTLASVTALLFGVAVLASLVPAIRAVRIDPLIALRSE